MVENIDRTFCGVICSVAGCFSPVFQVQKRAGDTSRGFTLIELLIVVAIIAILAAIAIPNFIEAQVRAKVSRVKADMHTIVTGLEAYAVDNNDYPPNDGVYNVVPIEVTTPISYLRNSYLVDPFSTKLRGPKSGHHDLARYYTYTRILSFEQFLALVASGSGRMPPVEGVDSNFFNPGALEKYGKWRLVSNGPDGFYSNPSFVAGSDPEDPNNVVRGSDILYDSTNGSFSEGNILRTQMRKIDRW